MFLDNMRLSREEIHNGETDWDYISRFMNEHANYYGDMEDENGD